MRFRFKETEYPTKNWINRHFRTIFQFRRKK